MHQNTRIFIRKKVDLNITHTKVYIKMVSNFYTTRLFYKIIFKDKKDQEKFIRDRVQIQHNKVLKCKCYKKVHLSQLIIAKSCWFALVFITTDAGGNTYNDFPKLTRVLHVSCCHFKCMIFSINNLVSIELIMIRGSVCTTDTFTRNPNPSNYWTINHMILNVYSNVAHSLVEHSVLNQRRLFYLYGFPVPLQMDSGWYSTHYLHFASYIQITSRKVDIANNNRKVTHSFITFYLI